MTSIEDLALRLRSIVALDWRDGRKEGPVFIYDASTSMHGIGYAVLSCHVGADGQHGGTGAHLSVVAAYRIEDRVSTLLGTFDDVAGGKGKALDDAAAVLAAKIMGAEPLDLPRTIPLRMPDTPDAFGWYDVTEGLLAYLDEPGSPKHLLAWGPGRTLPLGEDHTNPDAYFSTVRRNAGSFVDTNGRVAHPAKVRLHVVPPADYEGMIS